MDSGRFEAMRWTALVLAGAMGLAAAQQMGGGGFDFGQFPQQRQLQFGPAPAQPAAPGAAAEPEIITLIRDAADFTNVPGSAVYLDEATGLILVRQTRGNLKLIERLLQARQTVADQVAIEAKFIEVGTAKLRDLAVEFPEISNVLSGKEVLVTTETGFGTSEGTSRIGSFVGDRVNIDFGAAQLEVARVKDTTFSALVRAIEGLQGTNTLSAPKLVTLNRQKASVGLWEEHFIPDEDSYEALSFVVDANNRLWRTTRNPVPPPRQRVVVVPTEFEQRRYGLSLEVTPVISDDRRFIQLQISPVLREVLPPQYLGTGAGVAVTQEAEAEDIVDIAEDLADTVTVVYPERLRTLEANVVVADGTTVIIGGLIGERAHRDVRKVPVLGDIPVLRHLFRREQERSESTTLLIFVTAEILTPSGETLRAQAR